MIKEIQHKFVVNFENNKEIKFDISFHNFYLQNKHYEKNSKYYKLV